MVMYWNRDILAKRRARQAALFFGTSSSNLTAARHGVDAGSNIKDGTVALGE